MSKQWIVSLAVMILAVSQVWHVLTHERTEDLVEGTTIVALKSLEGAGHLWIRRPLGAAVLVGVYLSTDSIPPLVHPPDARFLHWWDTADVRKSREPRVPRVLWHDDECYPRGTYLEPGELLWFHGGAMSKLGLSLMGEDRLDEIGERDSDCMNHDQQGLTVPRTRPASTRTETPAEELEALTAKLESDCRYEERRREQAHRGARWDLPCEKVPTCDRKLLALEIPCRGGIHSRRPYWAPDVWAKEEPKERP